MLELKTSTIIVCVLEKIQYTSFTGARLLKIQRMLAIANWVFFRINIYIQRFR
jgi:hypothetical protein